MPTVSKRKSWDWESHSRYVAYLNAAGFDTYSPYLLSDIDFQNQSGKIVPFKTHRSFSDLISVYDTWKKNPGDLLPADRYKILWYSPDLTYRHSHANVIRSFLKENPRGQFSRTELLHLSQQKNCLSLKIKPGFLGIDIDNKKEGDDPDSCYAWVSKAFPRRVFTVKEHNPYSGGYHLVIRTNDPEAIRNALPKHKSFNIELKFPGQYLACPGSWGYGPVYGTKASWMTRCLNPRKSPAPRRPLESRRPKDFFYRIKPVRESLDLKSFEIHAGERNKKLLALARYLVFKESQNQGMSSAEVLAVIRGADRGSKDLRKQSDTQVLQILEGMKTAWREVIKRKQPEPHDSSGPPEFHSNLKLIPLPILNSLNRLCEAYNLRVNKSPGYEKWKSKEKQAFRILLLETLGSAIYQEQFPRKIRKEIALKPATKANFEKGYTFSDQWLQRLKSHYGLQVNVRRVFQKVLEISGLFSQLKFNSKGWVNLSYFGVCKQYSLSSSLENLAQYLDLISKKLMNLNRYFLFNIGKLLIRISPGFSKRPLNFIGEPDTS